MNTGKTLRPAPLVGALLITLAALTLSLLGGHTASASKGQDSKQSPDETLAVSPAIGGLWSPLNELTDVPVHISVLPDGRLLYWSRDKKIGPPQAPPQNPPQNPPQFNCPQDQFSANPTPCVYDVKNRSKTYVVDPLYLDDTRYTDTILNTTTNLFCSGHSFLPDGRLLVTGGHGKITEEGQPADADTYPMAESVGEKHLNIFDYTSNTWTLSPAQMEKGRWYPFNVTLASGETLIMSGTYWTGGFVNQFGFRTPFTAVNSDVTIRGLDGQITTRHTSGTQDCDLGTYYPYLSLTPDNKVFNAKPTLSTGDPSFKNHLLDPLTSVFTKLSKPTDLHYDGTSVMYAPGKVLLTNGTVTATMGGPPSNRAESIDLNVASPQWTAEKPLAEGRHLPTGTLLPDGKVLVTGGTNCPGYNRLNCGPEDSYGGAVQTPELWDPANPAADWVRMKETTSGEPRVYHSVALLMPDARVLVGGGGLPSAIGETAFNEQTGQPIICQPVSSPQAVPNECRKLGHKKIEFFSPPYLFNTDGTPARRPAIVSAPEAIAYGQPIVIDVGNVDRSAITRVVLMRLPSVTHTYNQDQRRVNLGAPTLVPCQSANPAPTCISVNAPANGNVCPPGPYMMFLIDNNGTSDNGRNVPSIARIVRVGDFSVTSNSAYGIGQSFAPTSASGASFSVRAGSTVNWSAASDSNWVTLVNSSGIGDGRVTFNVADNSTASGRNRSARITVKVPGRDDLGIVYWVYQAGSFADIGPSSIYYPFVNKIYGRGLTSGCAVGAPPSYCTEESIKRGQAAVFISALLHPLLPPTPFAARFGDVPTNSGLSPFVEYVARRGIVDSNSCAVPGNFCPEQELTRRDMIVWLLRAAGFNNPKPPAGPSSFIDVSTGDPAWPYIEEGVRRGIIAGCGGGRFCPDASLRRGQMAVFVSQTFGL